MRNFIYLDNAATTKMSDEVIEAMLPYFKESYGNASSHYSLGRKAKKEIDNSREIIASVLSCKPEEIYFTSGGSEANSWAIKGLKDPFHTTPMHIISSNQEHHSVLNALASRQKHNKEITYTLVGADKYGKVDLDDLGHAFRLNTRLCSIQMVNNETGIIQPIKEIAFKCKDEGCIFHTDAVQSFGHLKIDVKEDGIDMLSASAHKIHGPKGVGFLYISNDTKNQMIPLINGGQQERGLRGSTENVAGIVGLGKAVELAYARNEEINLYCWNIASSLVYGLSALPGVHTNVNLHDTDKRHISIRLDGIRAEEMVAMLDSENIFVSSGSACNSDSNEPSHVLKAIGLSDEEANSTIRVSISGDTKLKDVTDFISFLEYNLSVLRER